MSQSYIYFLNNYVYKECRTNIKDKVKKLKFKYFNDQKIRNFINRIIKKITKTI